MILAPILASQETVDASPFMQTIALNPISVITNAYSTTSWPSSASSWSRHHKLSFIFILHFHPERNYLSRPPFLIGSLRNSISLNVKIFAVSSPLLLIRSSKLLWPESTWNLGNSRWTSPARRITLHSSYVLFSTLAVARCTLRPEGTIRIAFGGVGFGCEPHRHGCGPDCGKPRA